MVNDTHTRRRRSSPQRQCFLLLVCIEEVRAVVQIECHGNDIDRFVQHIVELLVDVLEGADFIVCTPAASWRSSVTCSAITTGMTSASDMSKRLISRVMLFLQQAPLILCQCCKQVMIAGIVHDGLLLF